jgi:prepilin-type N-terminal cleavage/methylation domain-containing protein
MNQRGFTLVELMVALTTLAVVLGGVYALQQQGLNSYLMGWGRVEAQQDARLALDLLVRELRSAPEPLTTVAGCDAGTGDITFKALDDQNPTGPTVILRYRLNGTNLERTKDGTMTVLIGGVVSFTVRCFDASGVATAIAANVRSLTVAIQTRPQAIGSTSHSPANQQILIQSEVRLRNVL